MWTSNRGHISTASNVIILACVRMWWCKRREMLVEKPLIGQTVIAPYMKDAKYDILFTMKYIDMKFCRDVYGERGSGCDNIIFLQ